MLYQKRPDPALICLERRSPNPCMDDIPLPEGEQGHGARNGLIREKGMGGIMGN